MLTKLFWKKVGLSFIRAFIPTFLFGVLPVWNSIVQGDWTVAKAAFLALIAASVTAGFRAAQAMYTTLESQ